MNQEHRTALSLCPAQIRAIEKALSEKKRVEIVQTSNGLKLYTVMRREIE